MNMMSENVRRLLAPPLRAISSQRERVRLRRVPPIACDTSGLGPADADMVAAALGAARDSEEWQAVVERTSPLAITDRAGGVNPGDRRAIYALVRHLRPNAVLEIGTHIGASTAFIAEAMRVTRIEARRPAEFNFTTVDIMDVNDELTRPWVRYGSTHSPRELVRRLGCEGSVRFVARRSLEYMRSCNERYDLILLDGDHSAHTVYQEIPAAVKLLNDGGYILLHDFFPNLRPLWAGSPSIRGPWLATKRLRREGTAIRIVPLGALPWPTKLGSTVTSLALLGRNASD
jgi:predicted O-methyltransferase YrrM